MNARRLLPGRDDLVDGAFALALTILGVYGFAHSFGGTEYLVVGTICAVVGVLVAHLGNRLSAPVILAVPVLFIVYVVVGGAVGLRDRAFAGVFPSLSTVTDALRASVLGWKQLLTTVPPVGSSGSLMALPAFCGVMAAGSSMLWARRVKALAAPVLPPAAVLVTGLLFGSKSPVSTISHGGVLVALTVLWMALRNWRVRNVVAVGARPAKRLAAGAGFLVAASALGIVAAPALPFANADHRVTVRVDPPFDPAAYASPLSSYRDYLKQQKDDVLFTVTGLPEGVPVRLATMDEFDGIVWRVSSGRGSSGYFERVGLDISANFPGERATIRIDIKQWSQVWLPTVGEVLAIRFEGPRARQLSEAFRYNRATDTAATQGVLLRAGDSYEMDVVLPSSVDAADKKEVVDASGKNSDRYVPDALIAWAGPVVQKTELSDRPAKLVSQLGKVGVYSDGEKEQEISLGGHSGGRLENFIQQEQPVGNAEQFSAAMALMLRGESMPSRVMMAFLPRNWSPGTMEITGFDAEAFVEVPFSDIGWVAFAPTPDRKKTEPTQEPQSQPQPERNTQVPPPPPILVDDPRTEPASERDGEEQDEPEKVSPPSESGVPTWVKLTAAVAGPPVLVVSLLVGTVLLLKSRRRRRRRRAASAHGRIAGGWLELLDHATDLGRVVPPVATRREAGVFVSPSALALAQRADAAVWGGGEPSDAEVEAYWGDIVIELKEMDSSVGLGQRLRSRLSPRSLRAARATRRRAKRSAAVKVAVQRSSRSLPKRSMRSAPPTELEVQGTSGDHATGQVVATQPVEETVIRTRRRRPAERRPNDAAIDDTVIRSERSE